MKHPAKRDDGEQHLLFSGEGFLISTSGIAPRKNWVFNEILRERLHYVKWVSESFMSWFAITDPYIIHSQVCIIAKFSRHHDKKTESLKNAKLIAFWPIFLSLSLVRRCSNICINIMMRSSPSSIFIFHYDTISIQTAIWNPRTYVNIN